MSWKLDRPMQAPATKPDVVAILEESTFDPRILKACTLPECKRRMFDADKYTRAHGLLTVHTFGGGTWTSEFAVLTGLAHTLFGAAGLYAPYNLAPRVDHTLPRMFRAAGYRAIAIYPMTGDFLNARNAYDYYGFDAFYDGTQYGLGWESNDADLLKVFERIYADEKRVHPDKPLFVFMLTLHQHGPHMTPLAELPAPYDKPLFTGKFPPKDLDDWLNLNIGNYLERLQQSDAMIADLEKFLLGGDKPAVLMHFGDHQPSFDGAIHAIPKQVPKEAGPNSSMVTYYSIKSNLPGARKFDYPVLDIAFLGALVARYRRRAEGCVLSGQHVAARTLQGPLPGLQGHEHGRVVSRLRVQHAAGSARRMNAVAPLAGPTTRCACGAGSSACRKAQRVTARRGHRGARRRRRGRPRPARRTGRRRGGDPRSAQAHRRPRRFESALRERSRKPRRGDPRVGARVLGRRGRRRRDRPLQHLPRDDARHAARARCACAQPAYALIDGNHLPKPMPCPARAVVDGDAKEPSISAASIIAKTVRDRIMCELDSAHPGYGFARHKGYSTPEHFDALDRLGPCVDPPPQLRAGACEICDGRFVR